MTRVVVTGASRGIGRATALVLAERSVDVVLVGRPNAEIEAVAELVRTRGGTAEIVHADLSVTQDVENASHRILGIGTPDAVVFNAGIIERASIQATSSESWDQQLAVNARAPFVMTRELLPSLLDASRGRLVFIGSISSSVGSARAAAYCASKWALVGFVKSLALEISDSGLSAVCILPGSVDTTMLEGSGFSPRMSAQHVARTIVHFALDAPLAHNGGVVEMFGT